MRRSAAFHPGPGDGAPEGTGTLVLLGPAGPEFWQAFRGSAELADGGPDPLDRWSARVIGGLADALGAVALFPFGGPPWRPFTAWARASGEAWVSPVGLLVHARRRAPRLLPRRARACLSGWRCPSRRRGLATAARGPASTPARSGALTGAGYDVAACHDWLDAARGACLPGGRLPGAAGLPGRRRAAAGGAVGLSYGGLSWQGRRMRRLILMRHAKSSWADPSQRDLDRPLNKRGRKAAGLIGGWLKKRRHRPDAALVSSARRAQETWAGVVAAAGAAPTAYRPELYHASAETMLGVLREPHEAACLLMLGHQPGIGGFVRRLLADPPDDADFAKFPTGGDRGHRLRRRRWPDVAPGTGRLVDFVVPRALE